MTSDSPSLKGIDRKGHQASGAKQAFLRSFTGPVASGKMLLNGVHLTQWQILYILFTGTNEYEKQRTGKVQNVVGIQRAGAGGNRYSHSSGMGLGAKDRTFCYAIAGKQNY